MDELRIVLTRAAAYHELNRELSRLRRAGGNATGFDSIIGCDAGMQSVLAFCRQGDVHGRQLADQRRNRDRQRTAGKIHPSRQFPRGAAFRRRRVRLHARKPGRSFLSSTRPALIRHTRPLAVECHTGKFDSWTMSISAAAHFIVILVLISAYHASQVSQALLRSGERKYEVIYFSGTKLKHVQPIRVARGTKVASSTADGELKLPRSDKAVANLLAIRPV